MRVRSLALLLLVLGANTALSVYIGMTGYERATPYRAVQPREPTTEPLIQSTKPLAPLSQSTNDNPSLSKPAASIDPPTDSTQTQTLGETNNSQDTDRHASDTLRTAVPEKSGLNVGEGPKCNTQACSDAYRSFDAADCTYQPANGPRRACRK
jgi:BA14K-like protein